MDNVFSIEPIFDKNMDVEIDGWKKLNIVYSNELVSSASYLCWKIKNTEHVFRIPTRVVYENHGLNYKEHFCLTLKTFREDFIEWKKLGFTEDWMKRYDRIFSSYICIK